MEEKHGRKKVLLKDLKPKTFFSEPLYLDDTYVLLSPVLPVDEGLIKRLMAWEYREVYTDGVVLDSVITGAAQATSAEDRVEGIPTWLFDKERRLEAAQLYDACYENAKKLIDKFRKKATLDYQELISQFRALIDIISSNRRFILRALADQQNHEEYLISHAINTTIYSIIIGVVLKLQPFRIIELGLAAILHEIGMFRLPVELYSVSRPLSEAERKTMSAHTIAGYNVLKDISVPMSVCLPALEHHERIDGSGYPRKLKSEQISFFSKIIMVTCAYDAIIGERPYKDEADAHSTVIEMLKNAGKQFDDTVIRALVVGLGVFPIGTHVLLNNGKHAIVADIDEKLNHFPVVEVYGQKNPDGKAIYVKTSEKGIRILRALNKREAQSLPENSALDKPGDKPGDKPNDKPGDAPA